MKTDKKLVSKVYKILGSLTKPVGYSVACRGYRKSVAEEIVKVFQTKTGVKYGK